MLKKIIVHSHIFIFMLIVNISFGRMIQGYVYDADDKLPLPSYHVVILGKKLVTVYTDEKGFFSAYIPHDGLIHVHFENIGFLTVDVVDIPNQPMTDIGKIYIHLESYLRAMTYFPETKSWGQHTKKKWW